MIRFTSFSSIIEFVAQVAGNRPVSVIADGWGSVPDRFTWNGRTWWDSPTAIPMFNSGVKANA